MKKLIFLFSVIIGGLVFSSCEKCYECTKKCGVCTKEGFETLAGCQGDTALNGYSVEAWKLHLESQGYTCAYNNTVENVCGEENKDELSGKFYECLTD